MMRGSSLVLAALVAASSLAAGVSCSSDGFGDVRARRRLVVDLIPPEGPNPLGYSGSGAREAPLPLVVDVPLKFKVRVRALTPEGAPDTAFSNFVRLSSKPGAIQPLAVSGNTDGRNVRLEAGTSPEVDVLVTNAYGTTYIVAEELGYLPADPLGVPPKCANGIDDDQDGKIDYPADEGCAFANDDAEQGSSYAEGISPPIFIALPRVADVRGLTCQTVGTDVACSSTGITPYPKEQIQIEAGFDDLNQPRGEAEVYVTALVSNGFYIQDVKDARFGSFTDKQPGFNGLFVFNFNTPPRMRVCDRIRTIRGTAGEFFGFTQLSYPTWTLTEWNPRFSTCRVPDPTVLSPGAIGDRTNLLRLSGSLVRVESTPDRSLVVRVTPKLGSRKVPEAPGGGFVPAADATNCDFDDDGRIDFAPGAKEGLCSQACTADAECTEYSNFRERGTFRLTVSDSGNQQAAVQADASQSAGFDALALRGQELRAFSGVLTFFSGGSQFTIEARCKDDIITDPKGVPFPSDKRTNLEEPPPPLACVRPRTETELNPQ